MQPRRHARGRSYRRTSSLAGAMSTLMAAMGLVPARSASVEQTELRALLDSAAQPRVESVVVKGDWHGGAAGVKRQLSTGDPEAAGAAASSNDAPPQAAPQQQQPHQHAAHGAAPAAAGPRPSAPGDRQASTSGSSPHWLVTAVYGVTNLSSGAARPCIQMGRHAQRAGACARRCRACVGRPSAPGHRRQLPASCVRQWAPCRTRGARMRMRPPSQPPPVVPAAHTQWS